MASSKSCSLPLSLEQTNTVTSEVLKLLQLCHIFIALHHTMSFFTTPLDIAKKLIVWSIVSVSHDACNSIDDMFCTVCARRMSLTCQGFLSILCPYIWRHVSIWCGTNLAVPSYLSILYDAQSVIDFFSMEKHLTSFIQQIHVIAPFSSSVSTVTSRSYSIRDAVTDLIMLLPNICTAAFFNIVLDELPIYFGDCDHIKYLKLVFCRASIKGMNVFMNHFGHLDIMQLYLPEPTLSPLYFYNTQFLCEPCQGFTDYMCRSDQQSRPVIDKLIVLPAPGWMHLNGSAIQPHGMTPVALHRSTLSVMQIIQTCPLSWRKWVLRFEISRLLVRVSNQATDFVEQTI